MVTKPTIYTEKFALDELTRMLEMLLDEKNKDILLLGELHQKQNYHRNRITEWVSNYSENDKIVGTYNRIKLILECRLNKGGLKNKLNPYLVTFNLKNNYGWKDKTELEAKTENINKNIKYDKKDLKDEKKRKSLIKSLLE